MSDEYDDSVQSLAEQLAARGHDALVEQLRLSFQQAAAAHADVVSFDGDRLEAVVQNFIPRADGLQWRRALAAVASERLGIDLTEALNHPAVARAQEIVGAPSYEESLAELVSRTSPTGPLALNAGPSDTWQDEAESPAAQQDEAESSAAQQDEAESSAAQADGSEDAGASWLDASVDAGHEDATYATYATYASYEAEAAPDSGNADSLGSESDVLRAEPDPEPPFEAGASELGPSGVTDEGQEVEPGFEPAAAAYAPAAGEPDRWAPAASGSREPFEPLEPAPPDEPDAGAADDGAEDRDEPSRAYSTPAATTGQHAYTASEAHATDVATAEELPAEELPAPNYSAGSRLPEPSATVPRRVAPTATAAEQLRVAAIHLGGVANLTTHRQPVDLRLWEPGLDIVRADDEIIGRLGWEDIEALEVPAPRGLLRRRAPAHAQLVVRTESGDASFEIPELTPEELRARVQTLIDRFGRH